MTVPPTTSDPRAANLLFVAPGIAHLLGNALFTVQGRAKLLSMAAAEEGTARDQIESDADAVVEGATRSLGALAVLRWLLGEIRQPAAVGLIVHELVDVLRVPMRDHGGKVEWSADSDPEDEVDPYELAHALLSAMRQICAGRHAEAFTVTLTMDRIEGAAALSICSRGEARNATHGRPLGLVLDALQAESPGPGASWQACGGPDQLVLVLTGPQSNLRTS